MAKGLSNASIMVALEGDPSGFNRAATSAQKSVNKLTNSFQVSAAEAEKFVNNLEELERVQSFGKITASLAATKAEFVAAKKRARELGAEFKRTGSRMDELSSGDARANVARLSASIREQTALLRTEAAALRESGISTSDLVAKEQSLISALDKQASEWDQLKVAQKEAMEEQIRNTEEAARVQKAWGAIGVRSSDDVRAEIKKVSAAVRDLRSRDMLDQRAIDAARIKFVKLRGEIRGMSADQKKMKASLVSSMQGVGNFVSGMLSKWTALFGGLSMGAFAKGVFDVGRSAQSLNSAFEVITGSSKAAKEEIDYVRQVSKDLGLQFASTAQAYKALTAASKGSALEGQATKDIFMGIAQAATVLGMSADQTKGALNAIQQMISKGTVSAEELRGQLGERLPGAFGMVSKAMGVTTAELGKMLEMGEVTAEEMIPKLAQVLQDRFAAGAVAASENATQALNRLVNSWLSFRITLANSGFMDFATEKINDLSAALNDPAVRAAAVELMQSFVGMAEVVGKFIINYGGMIAKVGGSVAVLGLVNKVVLTLVTTWQSLNAVMAMTTGLKVIPFLRTFGSTVGGLVGTVAGLSTALAGLAAVWGAVQIYKATQAFMEMRDAQKMAGEAVAKSNAEWEEFQERLKKISKESGVTVTSFKEMRDAFASGAIAYDEATDTYSEGSGEVVEAAEAAAEAIKYVAKLEGDELKKAEEQWKEYSEQRTEILNKIAEIGITPTVQQAPSSVEGLQKIEGVWQNIRTEASAAAQEVGRYGLGISSAADEMFELSLRGKSDAEVQKARVQSANEYAAATRRAADEARKLASAGDIDGANQKWKESLAIADKWKEAIKASAVEVKTNWTPAMKSSLEKAKEAAKRFGKQYTEAMQDAKKSGDALRKTTDDLASAEKGLAGALRDAAREGMTAAQVYQDVTSEQRELERASKAAAAAGDYDLAIAKAREAQQVASELNQEVREGERVVISAEQAKKNASAAEISARKLEIEALKAKKAEEEEVVKRSEEVAEKAAAAKEKEVARVEELEKQKTAIIVTEAEAAEQAAQGVAEANQQIVDILEQQKTAVESLADSLNFEAGGSLGDYFTEAGKEAEALGTLAEHSAGKLREGYEQAAEAAIAKVRDLGAALDEAAKDRYATIYVKEVRQQADGGYVQGYAAGGSPAFRRLSSPYITRGSGTRDDVPAMLMRREFVLKAAAVHNQRLKGDGVRLAYAHNQGDLAGMQSLLLKHLGPPQIRLDLPAPPQMMSEKGNGGGERTFVFVDPATQQQAVVHGQSFDLDKLEQMMRHRNLVKSR